MLSFWISSTICVFCSFLNRWRKKERGLQEGFGEFVSFPLCVGTWVLPAIICMCNALHWCIRVQMRALIGLANSLAGNRLSQGHRGHRDPSPWSPWPRCTEQVSEMHSLQSKGHWLADLLLKIFLHKGCALCPGHSIASSWWCIPQVFFFNLFRPLIYNYIGKR